MDGNDINNDIEKIDDNDLNNNNQDDCSADNNSQAECSTDNNGRNENSPYNDFSHDNVECQSDEVEPGDNASGTVGMILGIVGCFLGVICGWFPAFTVWPVLMDIAAIVLGIVGLSKKEQKKGMAITGLVLGIVGILLIIVAMIVIFLIAAGLLFSVVGVVPVRGIESVW